VAAAVNVDPTKASPTMIGPDVKDGFVSARAAAGDNSNAADAKTATIAGRPAWLRAKAPRTHPPYSVTPS
jgi:hypothetical protein